MIVHVGIDSIDQRSTQAEAKLQFRNTIFNNIKMIICVKNI